MAQAHAEARGLLAGRLVCALAWLAVPAHGGMLTLLLMAMLIMMLLTYTGGVVVL